jgi:hypothetical protein
MKGLKVKKEWALAFLYAPCHCLLWARSAKRKTAYAIKATALNTISPDSMKEPTNIENKPKLKKIKESFKYDPHLWRIEFFLEQAD